jgi:hypothetical protein
MKECFIEVKRKKELMNVLDTWGECDAEAIGVE